MKKVLLPLLVLVMLCVSMAALAEENEAITLTLNTAKLPVYAEDDPYLAGFRTEQAENTLPVLLLPVKKNLQLQVTVEPKTVKNKKTVLSVDNEALIQVKGNTLKGLEPGEAILTITSAEDPSVTLRYRVAVYQPVTRISLTTEEKSVAVGKTVSLTAAILPENATLKKVSWASSDERIAVVDENGNVTGVKRGSVRITAMTKDGSNIRANYSIKVVQNPESITLPGSEMTVDVGRKAPCKATVEPKDTDDKKVIWTSSDESIATVNKSGQITGVSIGDCTITCTSEALDSVSASITVHVQQPVRKLTFNGKVAYAYVGEGTQLGWTIEPDNATNKTLDFKSSKEMIATVDANGIVTGVKGGKTAITAMTTDGSKRKAQITVQVGEHVTGVQMVRNHAYIDPGETATAGANIEPKDALNKNMTWVSSDPNIVTASGNTNHKMKLHGVNYGDAVITGTTEDGGFQTTLPVTVGDFDHGVSFLSYDYDSDGNTWLSVRNNLNFNITQITAELELWAGTLPPGGTTGQRNWRMVNFRTPDCGMSMTRGSITIVSFQIDGDWIKTITKSHRPNDYWN